VELEQRVTALELFFDLVFMFAITQVTGYVSARPSWTRLIEGLAILAVLWFAWSGYAWLGTRPTPTTVSFPALAALGMVTAAACRLIAFEFIRYSETRERIRHGPRRS
jgi:low temperature requirement protein LtrA